MILCRCKCGALFSVEDSLAGSTAECGRCQEPMAIPAASDPALALVLPKAGGEPEAVLRAEVPGKLAAGELSPEDRVWEGGTWWSLGAVFAKAAAKGDEALAAAPVATPTAVAAETAGPPAAPVAAPAPLRLATRAAAPVPASQRPPPPVAAAAPSSEPANAAPAVPVEPAEPAAVVAPAAESEPEAEAEAAASPLRLKRNEPHANAAGEGDAAPDEFIPAAPSDRVGMFGKKTTRVKSRSPIKKIVRGVVALAILYFGYQYGFGPILMNVLKKPTEVLVRNGEAIDYDATLGWRRLSMEAPRGSLCRFQVYIGMPETQTLVLTAKAGKGEQVRLKLHLRPGQHLLVNVKQATDFARFDSAAVKTRRLDAELEALAKQIADRVAPDALTRIADRVLEFHQAVYKGTMNDLFIKLPVTGFQDFYSETGLPAGAADDPTRITALPARRFEFANGVFSLNFLTRDVVDATVKIPAATVHLIPDVTVSVPEGTQVQVTRQSKRVNVRLALANQILKVPKGHYTGSWEYTASWNPLAKENAGWTWRWAFQGDGVLKGKKVRVFCTWLLDRPPTFQEQERR